MEQQEKNCLLITRNKNGEFTKTKITEEQLGIIFFDDGDRQWDQIQTFLPKPEWKKIYKDKYLVYEGFTVDSRAFGAGKVFYENGMPMVEGIFGIKGLLCGREYYTNGIIRFEGCFKLNQAYGPNYPIYGTWFDEEGKIVFQGKAHISRSSLGYPTIVEPEGFSIMKYPLTNENVFSWDDARKYMPQYQNGDEQG